MTDLVGETVTDLLTKSEEMLDIVGTYSGSEFDFECDNLAITSLDDQVDFAGYFPSVVRRCTTSTCIASA